MKIIRNGEIVVLSNGQAAVFQSDFALRKVESEQKTMENNSWKIGDGASDENAMIPRSMLWGGRQKCAAPVKPKINFVQELKGRRYYVMEMTRSKGLFYYLKDEDKEIRLFHKEEFDPRGIHIMDNFDILTTSTNADGSVYIALMDEHGRIRQQITSGDCVDENPFYAEGKIYYQSKGIARDQNGQIAAFSSSAIYMLDLKTAEIKTILSDEKYDFILPKVDNAGNVFCIRTPFKNPMEYGPVTFIKDVLLFPFRLLMALFAFLNAFSLFFTKKPLKTSTDTGHAKGEMDMSKRIIHDKLLDIQENLKREGKKVVAPKDWKLIRFFKGEIEEIASNVLCFDIKDNGEPVFSDGFAVYDMKENQIFRSEEIITYISV